MKKIILFLSLLIVNYSLSIATVRYVSHSGSNTPPYLTWETAADSIMSAINISSFGDTIYVANGVYEEQVVMIPGLSLIGAGMDSCIIDTRTIITANNNISVEIDESCVLKNFKIVVNANSNLGWGVAGGAGSTTQVEFNKVVNGEIGIFIDATFFGNANFTVYNNILMNSAIGIELFNSGSIIQKNYISTNLTSAIAAIRIGAFNNTYKPIIDSNYLVLNGAGAVGINKSYGAKPIITDNLFFLNPGSAIFLSYSDTVVIYNNLIWGRGFGIDNEGVEHMLAFNNYIGGEIIKGIIARPNDILENNVIANASIAIVKGGQTPPTVKYNNLWEDSIKYWGFGVTDTTNISVNPMVVNDDSTLGDLDFHLQAFSPLIDRGDPGILDKDSTRSDIGLYGGPFGESYRYIDLPPRTPVNFTAVLDTEYIKLSWNRNTEADFSNYNLYRDTMQGFPVDSTTLVASLKDTFYLQVIPLGIDNFYYRVTAADNQGNESEPSEERHIEIVSVKDRPKIFSSYELYQNYPNPFNPSTIIPYRLKEAGYVKLYIYDIKGELVRILVNQWQMKGYYEVVFNPTSNERSRASDWNIPIGPTLSDMASGVYLYQIMVKNNKGIPVFSDIGKMILLK